ncbi:MAG: hypothetical protein R3F43_02060 [bacterium]
MESLDPKEIRQVLRYWLALIRQEEALADRPRARPPGRGPFPVDLIEPRPGSPYFKLGMEGGALAFLMRTAESVEEPLNPERTAFLSHRLRISYQRERGRLRSAEPRGQQIHLGFRPSTRSAARAGLPHPVRGADVARREGRALGAPRLPGAQGEGAAAAARGAAAGGRGEAPTRRSPRCPAS